MVDDNQYVEAGTVLVQLDPKDYEVAVADRQGDDGQQRGQRRGTLTNVPLTSVNTSSQLSTAQADVDNATAGFAAAERQFEAAQASLREAEANDLKAQDDVERYRPLAAKDEIPQQQLHAGRGEPEGDGRGRRGGTRVRGGGGASGERRHAPRSRRRRRRCSPPAPRHNRSPCSARVRAPPQARGRAAPRGARSRRSSICSTRRSSRRSAASSDSDRCSRARTSRRDSS